MTVDDGSGEIDGDEVGDLWHQDLGEFLDGAVEIQRAADADTASLIRAKCRRAR